MSKTKLRPCPWCGNAVDLTLMSLSGVRVTCDCCAAEGPVRKSATAAKKAWNECHLDDCINALKAEVKALIKDRHHSLQAKYGADRGVGELMAFGEIRRLIGDHEAKLMQSEVVDRVREMADHFRDATKKGKGEKV